MNYYKDTITAIATAHGKGGIGVVRISGTKAYSIATQITQEQLRPRHTHYLSFFDTTKQKIDQGIVIYFKAPHSFTGEDIIEFQGHGGPVILNLILNESIKLGARIAEPGEFSQRAFLNNKIDLAQAEAIADMIDAASEQAARSALNSLQGDFSKTINQLVNQLIQLRVFVEAAIDFPEEEIDFLSDKRIQNGYDDIVKNLNNVFKMSKQGVLLREGIHIVIAGKPNAGKSSLLNALSGRDSAIVTHIAGTTRDTLKESVQINGIPLHIIDTAGIRHSEDFVEQEGIKRALQEISKADHILMVCDITDPDSHNPKALLNQIISKNDQPKNTAITYVINKIDLKNKAYQTKEDVIHISAKTSQGMDDLKTRILKSVGFQNQSEGIFTARTRHIKAMEIAQEHLDIAHMHIYNMDGELLAEELRLTQNALSQITGSFSSDDLLSEIFSSFCIGK